MFLSHAGADSAEAKALALGLREAGVPIVCDVLPGLTEAGTPFQPRLEEQLAGSTAFLVLVGAGGTKNWVRAEVDVALERQTKDPAYRVVPVLLPGVRRDVLPAFLGRNTPVFLPALPTAMDAARFRALAEELGFPPPPAAVASQPAPLRPLVGPGPPPALPARPYPLLSPYDDPRLFAGRERDLAELLERLAEPAPILGVYGVSGVGKSSLFRAGLVPALRAAGVPAALTARPTEPGLCDFLLAQLVAEPPETAGWADFVAILRRLRADSAPPPVLVLDQFEDCFLKDESGTARARLGPLIAATFAGRGTAHGPLCRFVLGYRHEFHGRVQEWLHDVLAQARHSGLAGLDSLPHELDGQDRFRVFIVPPLGKARPGEDAPEVARAAFSAAITRPLRLLIGDRPAFAYTLADDGAERLATAFAAARDGQPDAPLVPELQVVLARLLDKAATTADGSRPLRVPPDVQPLIDGALRTHVLLGLRRAYPDQPDGTTAQGRTLALVALQGLVDREGRRGRRLSAADLAKRLGPDSRTVLGRLAAANVRLIVGFTDAEGLHYELSHDRIAHVLAELRDREAVGLKGQFDRQLLDLDALVSGRSLQHQAGDAGAVDLDRAKLRAVRAHRHSLLWNDERRAWFAACEAAAAVRARRRRRNGVIAAVVLVVLAVLGAYGVRAIRVQQHQASLSDQLRTATDPDTLILAADGLLTQHGASAGQLAEALGGRKLPPEALYGDKAAGRHAARLALVRAQIELAAEAEDFGALIGALDELGRSPERALASEAARLRPEVVERLRRYVAERAAKRSPGSASAPGSAGGPPEDGRLEDGKLEWVDVPGGTFRMGCLTARDSTCHYDEEPPHDVTLEPFRLLAHEVTAGQFEAFESGLRPWLTKRAEAHDAAYAITWYAAVAYAAWVGGRLPTEAEWEYACRAGTATPYSAGAAEAQLQEAAWYTANSEDKVHEVKTRQPNPWRLHDLHGNLSEWVSDRYGSYAAEAQQDPAGPEVGAFRVLRGGSWNDSRRFLRTAVRSRSAPAEQHANVGFRVVRPAPEP